MKDHNGKDGDGNGKKKKNRLDKLENLEYGEHEAEPGGMTERSEAMNRVHPKKRFRWGEYKPFLLG